MGLIDFRKDNIIQNVDESNNKFNLHDREIKIPWGSYEIKGNETFILNKIEGTISLTEQNSVKHMHGNTIQKERANEEILKSQHYKG